MIKVSVMYPNTPGGRFDHDYYRDKHMPLVKARMGDACKSYTVDKGMAGGAQRPEQAALDAALGAPPDDSPAHPSQVPDGRRGAASVRGGSGGRTRDRARR